ncbi:MAG: amino acid ABC transporter permease [Ruminococcaceae bacterium]|nr:amino acid ABC transporter permease [Oscillospiraceae bacterium]
MYFKIERNLFVDKIREIIELIKFNILAFIDELKFVFVDDARYELLLNGFLNTLKITAGALVVGILIGIVIAAIRSSYDKNKESMKLRGGLGYRILSVLNAVCKLYLTVIRGTPVVVQLMISYFVIFVASQDGVPVAIFAFGINSGAYVAEIFRAGIMSIDNGQFEAGRSLGFNYFQTMRYIIIPQMFKAVLPTLCNEFIALLKETSVAGYVGVMDITKAGNVIAGRTFEYFIPLFTVALVYLVMVMILSSLVGKLERRLRKSER